VVERRESVIAAAVRCGLLAAAVTEFLSALGRLTHASVVAAWGVIATAAGLLAARRLLRRGAPALPRLPPVEPGLELAVGPGS
jgi:hypothetical protein